MFHNKYIFVVTLWQDETDPKKKEVTDDFFFVMNSKNPKTGLPRVQEAFERASIIYGRKKDTKEESVTTMHLLVQSLLNLKSCRGLKKEEFVEYLKETFR